MFANSQFFCKWRWKSKQEGKNCRKIKTDPENQEFMLPTWNKSSCFILYLVSFSLFFLEITLLKNPSLSLSPSHTHTHLWSKLIGDEKFHCFYLFLLLWWFSHVEGSRKKREIGRNDIVDKQYFLLGLYLVLDLDTFCVFIFAASFGVLFSKLQYSDYSVFFILVVVTCLLDNADMKMETEFNATTEVDRLMNQTGKLLCLVYLSFSCVTILIFSFSHYFPDNN